MPKLSSRIDVGTASVIYHWHLPATPEQVWAAWTHDAPLSRWLGTLRGGTFGVGQVVTIEHAPDYLCTSQIQRCEPAKLLVMSWKFPDEKLSLLHIRLTSAQHGTKLSLVHKDLADQATNYLNGWHTHLRYLDDLLSGTPRSMEDFWTLYEQLAEASKETT